MAYSQAARLNPPIDPERDHILGSAEAPVTLVEYADFECPFCGKAYPVVNSLRRGFDDQLRFVYRHFPRPEHPHARLAAEAAEAAEAAAAQREDAFWTMHQKLFEHQDALDEAHLLTYAREIGLDPVRFQQDLANHTYLERVHADLESAVHSEVHASPTFFINGIKHEGTDSFSDLARAIHAEELREQSANERVEEAPR